MTLPDIQLEAPTDIVPADAVARHFPGAIILPFADRFPRIDASCFIAPSAVVIGDVEIGAKSSVWYGCVLRGDVNSIRVGRGVNLQDGTIVHVNRASFATFIGDDVTIGHRAVIHACTLQAGAFVGMSATVLDGAVVDGGAIVGAGALVGQEKHVAAGELWGGVPARKLRDIGTDGMPMLAATARHYADLAAVHQGIVRQEMAPRASGG
ncbi:gamma carbonic anhydrase family protein [Tistrella bauzanensis]|uniref:Gamma carbonic anhydrase family protein n=1 Tax=Tistrella bauzanensis TaxID=657419 RepID=A0ABQ1I8A0_9PROT|nr:gamma carbonic anhydrase family protein [Tistrella bauzanensis]GGB26561.1 gamma carbonic anhydrase family protein [Tistrella bauzanensis]